MPKPSAETSTVTLDVRLIRRIRVLLSEEYDGVIGSACRPDGHGSFDRSSIDPEYRGLAVRYERILKDLTTALSASATKGKRK